MKNPTGVCIVGASFCGLSSVLQLRKRLGDSIEITLFDIQEQFTYLPGLHEAVLDTNSLGMLQFDLAKYYP